ncbi:hypothetical protein [Pedobacter sp. GR22-10]|uniref:hypothetical protein n=1 Tax=Pedobacter sp. GR22-10 TaxID=2994472 RepID=UPI0022468232|nr:hypothetical protein [Pedobacter sp. GR22-10]MCX2430685.1 hypothetical protein [Pedobacter sp. GR22-10]
MPLKIIYICCLLFLNGFVQAQNFRLDSVAINLKQYGLNSDHSSLFLHFDKNIYSNNDQVWFTGYLLNTVAESERYHTLYLSLVNNADTSIVLQEKFLIKEGIAFGSLALPDSLPSGRYRFVAHTNMKINDHFDGEFTQPITVKSTTINPLTANVSIFKNFDEQTKNGTVLLQVLSGNNRFVENAEINYQIGNADETIKTGKAKSSVIGELMINYPAEKITKKNNLLKISIKKNNHLKYVNFNLPVQDEKMYQFSFYPEGGYLIDGLTNKVGFELKTENGNVVQGTAVLYENEKVLDTIYTNLQGIGSFVFQPNRLKRYYAQIIGAGFNQYDLPTILNHGVALRLSSAISNHELKAQIESNDQQQAHVVVHDFSNILLQSSFDLQANRPQNMRFKLDSIPIGLYALTVLNNEYKPIAERIFFAHYNKINRISVITDKENYTTRDSVELDLNAIGRQNKLLPAMVSVSCVQTNRLSIHNNQNITDFYFFQQLLADLPTHQFNLKYNDINYLNEVLMVRGWRRYQWPTESLPNVRPKLVSLEYSGEVLKNRKQLKTPLILNTFAGSNINVINTDSLGKFNLTAANLLSEDRGRVWLNIGDKRYANYEVLLNDPLKEIRNEVINQKISLLVNQTTKLNDLNQSINITNGITLKDVVIKSKKDNFLNFAEHGPNRCGDYVCRYNILNCANHAGYQDNRKPLKGKSYVRSGGGTIVYAGCTDHEDKPNLRMLKGIHLAKEFYTSDVSNKSEPISFATIYWNYQVVLHESGNTRLVFNTGDLTGKFKIIVQGITSEGVAYGEKEINVAEK